MSASPSPGGMGTGPAPAPAPTPMPPSPSAAGKDLAPAASVPGAGVRRALRLAGVAGVFVVLVALAMVASQWVQPTEEPWSSPALKAAHARLALEPKNEALKKEIRDLDLRLRQAYFRGLERNRRGAWLLLGGGVLLVVVARAVFVSRRFVEPRLAGPALDREGVVRRARATVLATGGVCAVGFAALGLASRSRLPEELARTMNPPGAVASGGERTPVAVATATSGAGAGASAGASVPSPGAGETGPGAAELAKNWPRFRGFDGSGAAPAARLPLEWDVASGKGIAWKAAVPLTGYNSPVVWGDRVFLTGGDKKARLVFCFDLANGALVWQRPVLPTNAPVPAVEPPDQSGPAASSVATDGRRVFAVFASGELGALDFAGNLAWHKKLDFSGNSYGHAASLVVWRDRLFVQADQGQAEDGKSALHALDTATGNPRWTTQRPVGGSWTTPVVIEVGGKPLVVTAGDPWLMAHDAVGGAEVWRAKVLGGELAPSPVPAGDFVVAVSPGHAVSAVKPDGTGDVTGSHVAWKLENDVPDVPTPVAGGGLLFTASTEGRVFARELATGKAVWDHNFEVEIQSSPLLAGDRVYLLAQPGKVFVVAAAKEFRQLAAFDMAEEIYASPAVAGDRLLIRTKSNLYCIGGTAGGTAVAGAGGRTGGPDGR